MSLFSFLASAPVGSDWSHLHCNHLNSGEVSVGVLFCRRLRMPESRLGSEVKERKFGPYGQSGPDWQICSQRLYWLSYSIRFITLTLQLSMWIFDIYGGCKVLSFAIGHACTRKHANSQCALYGEWFESPGPKTILKITSPTLFHEYETDIRNRLKCKRFSGVINVERYISFEMHRSWSV